MEMAQVKEKMTTMTSKRRFWNDLQADSGNLALTKNPNRADVVLGLSSPITRLSSFAEHATHVIENLST
jgi:hypothetical protein